MPYTSLNPQQIPARLSTLAVTSSPILADKVAILSGGIEKTVTLSDINTLLGTWGGAPSSEVGGFDTISSVTYDSTGRLLTLVSEGITYTLLYNARSELSKLQTVLHEWTITRDAQSKLISITKVTRDYTDPVISVVSYGTPGEADVTITWTTDEVSTTQVEYGTTIGYWTLTTLNATPLTTHSVTITGLALNTLYYFRVRSVDPTGNDAISDGYTFTTLEDNYIYLLWSTLLKRVRLGDMSTNGSISLAGDACKIFAAVGQFWYTVNVTDQTIDKYNLTWVTKVWSLATTHPVQSMCTDGTDLFYTMSNGSLGWVVKITLSTFTTTTTQGGIFNIWGPLTTDATYVYYCRISGTNDVRKATKAGLTEDPVGIVCSPTTNGLSNSIVSSWFLYVPLSVNSLKKINVSTWLNVWDVTVGSTPRAMCESGGFIYVCNYVSNTISKVRISDYTEIATLSVNNPHSIKAFGGFLYVPSVTDMTLKKISEASFTVSSTISIGEDPKWLFII